MINRAWSIDGLTARLARTPLSNTRFVLSRLHEPSTLRRSASYHIGFLITSFRPQTSLPRITLRRSVTEYTSSWNRKSNMQMDHSSSYLRARNNMFFRILQWIRRRQAPQYRHSNPLPYYILIASLATKASLFTAACYKILLREIHSSNQKWLPYISYRYASTTVISFDFMWVFGRKIRLRNALSGWSMSLQIWCWNEMLWPKICKRLYGKFLH